MNERYIDFEILFGREPSEDGTYDVQCHVSPSDRRVAGTFQSPFTAAEQFRSLEWIERGRFDDASVADFGTRLFEALFTGDLRSTYDQLAAGTEKVRYRLVVQDAAIAVLPWELMHDPVRREFLSDVSPLVRNIAVATAAGALHIDGPLRILLVDAQPSGVETLDTATEAASLKDAFRRLRLRDQAEVKVLSHATRDDLRQELRQAANADPPIRHHILHFVGHGALTGDGEAQLFFEDDNGRPDPVTPDELIDDIRDHGLSLVFLNACHSANATSLETANAFAPALLQAGVPAVIGMQVAVFDSTAVTIAREFYRALADGEPVDGAITAARRLTDDGGRGQDAQIGIPVVYLRSSTGSLFDMPRPPRFSAESLVPWLRFQLHPRRLLANIWALIGVVALLLGLVLGALEVRDRYFQTPEAMNGDFNVAVAGFGEFATDGSVVASDEGLALAKSLYEALTAGLEELDIGSFTVEVRGPDDLDALDGRTQSERAEQAAAIAEEIDAHLVIYGVVSASDTRSRIEPEFYLSPRRLRGDGEQLAGQYGLGSPIEVPGHAFFEFRDDVRSRLLSRTDALALFVVGVTRYTQMRFDVAAARFEEAIASGGWDPADGKELAYLFLGNTRGKLGDLAGARDAYDEALQLEPGYARALLGRAEVLFISAQPDGCEASVDVDGLDAAAETFDQALVAPVQPESAEIPTRVTFGKARIYACMFSSGLSAIETPSIAEDDLLGASRTAFATVIGEYADPRQRIREMVAESYAGLGLTYLLDTGDDANASYEAAADAYADAVELTSAPDRRALFERMLGFVAGRRNQCDVALEHYTRAIDAVADDTERDRFVEERDGVEARIAAGEC